jgi:hypothetical protein
MFATDHHTHAAGRRTHLAVAHRVLPGGSLSYYDVPIQPLSPLSRTVAALSPIFGQRPRLVACCGQIGWVRCFAARRHGLCASLRLCRSMGHRPGGAFHGDQC